MDSSPLTLALGAWTGVHYNALRVPPSFWTLVQPALNLAALGLPIYGYTLLASALDQVRWRPTMIGSVLTLAGFIAWVIAMIPVLHKYSWRIWLERVSIFKLYNPVDAVSTRELLSFNIAVLAAIARRLHRPGLRRLRPPRPAGQRLSRTRKNEPGQVKSGEAAGRLMIKEAEQP